MRRLRALVLLAGIMLAAAGSAEAGKPCLTYAITTPATGVGNGVCSPTNLPLSQPVIHNQCTGVPPAGLLICGGVVLYLP